MPYLEVEQGNTEEIEKRTEVTVPDVIGKTLEEAEKIIKESGLEVKINNEVEELDKSTAVVSEQLPQAGITVYNESCVYLDYILN